MEWDEKKREANILERGLDFADANEIFEQQQVTRIDRRADYGEPRYVSLGMIKGRLMAVVYTERERDVIRIISFRKANKREQKFYESTIRG